MKHPKIALSLAFSLTTLSSAMALPIGSLQSKVTCVIKKTNAPFAVILEGIPSKNLATIQFPEGNESIVKFSQAIESSEGGCYVHDKITKTFFHPYYDIEVSGTETYGLPHTRCAGGARPLSFTGTFSAEGQDPLEIACKSSFSFEKE